MTANEPDPTPRAAVDEKALKAAVRAMENHVALDGREMAAVLAALADRANDTALLADVARALEQLIDAAGLARDPLYQRLSARLGRPA